MLKSFDELYNQLSKLQFGYIKNDTENEIETLLKRSYPLLEEIDLLKKEKAAIVLAHTYVDPVILYGCADYTGDSYGLSKAAKETAAQTIIFAGVRFMGETAKLLSPNKTILIPAEDGGCTLADSITGEEVKRLKTKHPDYAFACYINTTADVKAACDICVTSSNVYNIIEDYPSDKIMFLPDRWMGENIIAEMENRGVKKDIINYEGACYLHEEFTPDEIKTVKATNPDLTVMAHPECRLSVTSLCDYTGSTTQMIDRIKQESKKDLSSGNYLLLSEKGAISRCEVETPSALTFLGEPKECRYMRSNSLEGIIRVLKDPRSEDYVEVDPALREDALLTIEKMFEITEARD